MKLKELLAMRRESPRTLAELLASKAVKRGAKWLLRNAPDGWHRNLFEPLTGGHSLFRVHSNENISSALALSFEHCPEYADPATGYVNEVIIAERFKLSLYDLQFLGFSAGFGMRKHVTGTMLDKAWRHELGELHLPTVPRRHNIVPLRQAA